MMVGIFEQLGIASWRGIYQMWMLFEQFIKVLYLTKFSNVVLSWTDIVREESRDQWGLGKPEDVAAYDFLVFSNTDSLDWDSEIIST